jgi:hypothetical protein
LLIGTAAAFGQALPAAIRNANLEAGGHFTFIRPDYGDKYMAGIGGVVDVNARKWYGLEFEGNFNFINGPAGTKEQTYMIGPRILYVRDRWIPYAKVLFGIGGLTFPNPGNPHHDYGEITMGGGVDWRWKRNLTIRVIDFEYQDWYNFGHANDPITRAGALTPIQASVGIKYRFFQ